MTTVVAPTAILFAQSGPSMALGTWLEDVSIWARNPASTVVFPSGLAPIVFIGLTTSRSVTVLDAAEREVAQIAQRQRMGATILAQTAAAMAHALGCVITGGERSCARSRLQSCLPRRVG